MLSVARKRQCDALRLLRCLHCATHDAFLLVQDCCAAPQVSDLLRVPRCLAAEKEEIGETPAAANFASSDLDASSGTRRAQPQNLASLPPSLGATKRVQHPSTRSSFAICVFAPVSLFCFGSKLGRHRERVLSRSG